MKVKITCYSITLILCLFIYLSWVSLLFLGNYITNKLYFFSEVVFIFSSLSFFAYRFKHRGFCFVFISMFLAHILVFMFYMAYSAVKNFDGFVFLYFSQDSFISIYDFFKPVLSGGFLLGAIIFIIVKLLFRGKELKI